MLLLKVFDIEAIKADLKSITKKEAFEELLDAIKMLQPEINTEEALKALITREEMMSTGIMPQIALPHALCPSVEGTIGAIGISRRGIGYDALDGSPVHLIFMLLSNPDNCSESLRVLKHLALLLESPDFVSDLMGKKNPEEIQDMLNLQKFSRPPLQAVS